jgi:hypothetical protein
MIPAERKLIAVSAEVFLGHVVKRPVDATLEQGEEAFNGIRRYRPPGVFFLAVIDREMP